MYELSFSGESKLEALSSVPNVLTYNSLGIASFEGLLNKLIAFM